MLQYLCALLPHFVCSAEIVITGFNTDIEHEGVVYHVQTEDKGLSKPVIMSLVYNRGIILASKRVSYDDLLTGSFDESQLAARLQRQHRLICAAIQAGRIEELKKMSAKETAEVAAEQPKAVPAPQPAFAGGFSNGNHHLPDFDSPIPKPVMEDLPPILGRPSMNSLIHRVGVIEDVLILDEAVSIFDEGDAAVRPINEKLSIELVGESRLRGGDRKSVGLMACRGSARKVVGNAQIMVKILGSSFRPLIFHASTDANGMARVDLQLPNFYTGRAAMLVRAVSDGEEVELRRTIEHG